MDYETMPGTRLVRKTGSASSPEYGFLNTVFTATSGLVLSQIREISGVDTPALQNWIKRGYVPNPVNKRYSINSVARILIINMLRSVMLLDDIAALFEYISPQGSEKKGVCESELYNMLCNVIGKVREENVPPETALRHAADRYNTDEKYLRDRLFTALKIMYTAYESASAAEVANDMLRSALKKEHNSFNVKKVK